MNPPLMLRCAWHATLAIATLVLASVCAAQTPPADPNDGQHFRALAFHDVRPQVRASMATQPDETAVDERMLADFFAWLRQHGHQPVSLQQIVDARAGRAPLPPRAVLLTFDDGYSSTYTRVFPLLQQFNYPATVALVTHWMEQPPGSQVTYGESSLPRENFLSWKQVREMQASGLIEFISHTHDMHRGHLAIPQGNQLPAAASLAHGDKGYESLADYTSRIAQDLRRSQAIIETHTGVRVRALAWPYGAYNATSTRVAQEAGLDIQMNLDDGPNHAGVPLTTLRRALPTYDQPASNYIHYLRSEAKPAGARAPAQRFVHIDLDYVYDPNPAQQEANLSQLVQRIATIRPRSVFLQAFADPDGDGAADAVYFPNRHLPVRADLFARAAWQLKKRAGVQVYAWMPVLAWRLPTGHPLADRVVTARTPAARRYHRLTPFDESVRGLIGELYEDLGHHARFDGVLFHDDALLGDDEDASPAARLVYDQWGLGDPLQTPLSPEALTAWTAHKARWLTDFTLTLAARSRAWNPGLKTARNIYAQPVLEPQAEHWFSQKLDDFLAHYDHTVLMAMPYMEQQDRPLPWLRQLVQAVARRPDGLERTLFELQARDWRTNQPVPDAELARQMRHLQNLGVRHLGYYPDDFVHQQPGVSTAREALSTQWDPVWPPPAPLRPSVP